MFYSETFIDFNLTSAFIHCSMCICHMSLTDLLTDLYHVLWVTDCSCKCKRQFISV